MQKQSAKKQGFGVAASPFNPIKLKLGIILLFAVLLLVICSQFNIANGWQLLIAGGYGLSTMLYLIVHTRRILIKQQSVGESL